RTGVAWRGHLGGRRLRTEGGAGGGQVVAAGTPEEVAAQRISYTGAFLADLLRDRNRERRRA
ncbi:MAG: hypothetical protein OXI50_04055, partial [Gammaproteobacteria bacterium]|nr:hypothetical protein [Gammaproteobacteria bacterium]